MSFGGAGAGGMMGAGQIQRGRGLGNMAVVSVVTVREWECATAGRSGLVRRNLGAAVVLVRGLSSNSVMITQGPCSAHRGTAAAVHLADKLTREQSPGLGDGVEGCDVHDASSHGRRQAIGLTRSRKAAKLPREPHVAFEYLRCCMDQLAVFEPLMDGH